MQTEISSDHNHVAPITSNTPVTLSVRAVEKIREFCTKIPEAKGKLFRVFVEGGGCSGYQYGFKFDDLQNNDQKMTFDGVDVVIDKNSLALILGAEIDYVETMTSAGFSVKNPQAKASCGCGTSFSV